MCSFRGLLALAVAAAICSIVAVADDKKKDEKEKKKVDFEVEDNIIVLNSKNFDAALKTYSGKSDVVFPLDRARN